MAEVHSIEVAEQPSQDQDHVLIIQSADGTCVANGSAAGRVDVTYWKPPPFDTLEAALAGAQVWAGENDVAYIFVRESV